LHLVEQRIKMLKSLFVNYFNELWYSLGPKID
jgi:hypothetical protein